MLSKDHIVSLTSRVGVIEIAYKKAFRIFLLLLLLLRNCTSMSVLLVLWICS